MVTLNVDMEALLKHELSPWEQAGFLSEMIEQLGADDWELYVTVLFSMLDHLEEEGERLPENKAAQRVAKRARKLKAAIEETEGK